MPLIAKPKRTDYPFDAPWWPIAVRPVMRCGNPQIRRYMLQCNIRVALRQPLALPGRWTALEQGAIGAHTGKHDRYARPLSPPMGRDVANGGRPARASRPGTRTGPPQGGDWLWRKSW